MFLQTDKSGSALDLLNNEPVELQSSNNSTAVCLVRPVHIPANHGRVVEVKPDSTLTQSHHVLFVARNKLADQGLSIEDGIIELQNTTSFMLAVCNHNSTPIDLEMNQVVGSLVPEAKIVESVGESDEHVAIWRLPHQYNQN